jgi:hypothetical protein
MVVTNLSKCVAAGIVGFLIWEPFALVLGNQPNIAFVSRLMAGDRT